MPTGKYNINNQIVDYEQRFDDIADNFKNPTLPNPLVKYEGKDIGRAIDCLCCTCL